MKKLIALLLALVMVFALAACGAKTETAAPAAEEAAPAEAAPAAEEPAESIKVALIALHDENSGYDKNFIDAFKAACEATGVEGVIKTNVAEDQACYDAAAEFADDGCSVVFADSYGHQSYILQAAQDFPEVQFTSCTGDTALLDGVENFHNAFATIYEGRYLAGIAAGMKLNEMIAAGEITEDEAKMGYVGAMPYAEVKSGYTSFYLGAKSVCPSVTMDVVFTGSWYDETLEKEGAESLIKGGCVLISQHADSMGAPNACESAGVPNVSYNGSTQTACPNTYIISSRINWTPYFIYAIEAVKAGGNYDTDWCGTLATESVLLTEVNEAVAAEGTAEAIEKAVAGLKDGSVKVFDSSAFSVGGEAVASSFAIDTDGDWVADTSEAVYEGAYNESVFRSAPYFALDIDGITILE